MLYTSVKPSAVNDSVTLLMMPKRRLSRSPSRQHQGRLPPSRRDHFIHGGTRVFPSAVLGGNTCTRFPFCHWMMLVTAPWAGSRDGMTWWLFLSKLILPYTPIRLTFSRAVTTASESTVPAFSIASFRVYTAI